MLSEISIEILQRCPNRCIYCSSHSNPQATHIIPFDIIKNIIDDAKSLGCKTVCLSGGEPFLHPQILDIISYIAKQQLICYVYTSGIYMKDEVYSSLPNEYIEAIRGMVDKVIFNVEADSSTLYDQIMGTDVGGFDMMKKSINDCVSSGLVVETHVVPMQVNFKHLKSIFEMCYQLGVSKVSILRLVLQGRALENLSLVKLTGEDSREVTKLIKALKEAYKGKVRIGLPYSDSNCRIYCKAASDKINVRYDGNVYPCEVFKDDLLNAKLGCDPDNVWKDSFYDIYKSSPYLNVVRRRIEAFKKEDGDETCYGQFKMEKL
jgi:MoaA/NifB/PqqE/SkfB family radical SAM enzyme